MRPSIRSFRVTRSVQPHVMLRTPPFGGRTIPTVSLQRWAVDSSCELPRSFYLPSSDSRLAKNIPSLWII